MNGVRRQFTQTDKCQPHGGAGGKVRKSPKSLIHHARRVTIHMKFLAIHSTVDILVWTKVVGQLTVAFHTAFL